MKRPRLTTLAPLARRLASGAVVTLAVVVGNFFLFRLAPGNAANLGLVPNASPEMRESLERHFGLDHSTATQLKDYLLQLAHGNLGVSFANRQPVAANLWTALVNTLTMVVPGLLLALALAVITGVYAAWRRGSASDHTLRAVALTMFAIPGQWLGMVLLYVARGHLPAGGISDAFLSGTGFQTELADRLQHMVLPCVTYALIVYGAFMIVLRTSLVETLSEDYILAAKAHGLSNKVILRRHALRNALLPLVTLVGLTIGTLLAGVILVESVFSWPGLGEAIYNAVTARDYPMLQGAFLLLTVAVVLSNLVVDLTYSYLDPRVRM
jgi:ABC-type dipeptide/oligopeptide/nickel transport system permease component